MTWPVGSGQSFRGTYDVVRDRMLMFSAAAREKVADAIEYTGVDDPELAKALPADQYAKLVEDVELVRAGYPEFSRQAYLEGHLTPVFFGSAYNNFGVREILDALAAYAPSPRPQPAEPRPIEPTENKVGLRVQGAGQHGPQPPRPVAFMRLCAGRFQRGMKLKQIGTGKMITIGSPILFFARDREIVDEAWPGDIIGVPNHGTLRVGDTLTEGEALRITGIPNFAPEMLRRVRLEDPMKSKQLRRALEDLSEEGVTQVFRRVIGGDWIVGVVGALQLDVLQTRVETEYQVKIALEQAPFETARWISADSKADLDRFMEAQRSAMAAARDGPPVYMARNAWELNTIRERFPAVRFAETRERH